MAKKDQAHDAADLTTSKAESRNQRSDAKAADASSGKGGRVDLDDPELYLNRELSLLAFQHRVLEEAEDATNPLLDRLNFLSILGSNLDEFFMVRVAGLAAQLDAGTVEVGPDGISPRAQLVAIRREIKKLMSEAHRCLEQLVPLLTDQGICIHDYAELTEGQLRRATTYFSEVVFPVLTPLAFDPGRPFPHISNLSLNLAVLIRDRSGRERFARVKVPDSLPQLVPLNQSGKANAKRKASKRVDLVWLEEVIIANLGELFPGMEILQAHPFHVTRDADIAIKELEAEDLLETIEEGVRQRRFGSVMRLIVTHDMPAPVLAILMENLELDPSDVYKGWKPLSLKRLSSLFALDRPELKYAPFVPTVPDALVETADDADIFALIRRRDILVHHPFDSFQPVIDFLQKAARDPAVLAIKMCLYRVGRNSPVVQALLEAVEEEKQVAVLVELKARFDEESNIEWARALERAGVHVVYGLIGLKIHSKVALVVRREHEKITRYVHIATGNYNAVTAHLYTDMGVFTCDEDVADDVSDLFNYLTGYSENPESKRLLVAPMNLRQRLEALIDREIKHAKAGRKGHLIFKMNALTDRRLIRLLYEASRAGVKVELLVRGICSLRPGIPGISDHIEVTSIVGRFLEHSRIYHFDNCGESQVYLGSADLMPRNIEHRVEVLMPIRDAGMVHALREVLKGYLSDNVKARLMLPNGAYIRKSRGKDGVAISSQERLLAQRAPQSKSRRRGRPQSNGFRPHRHA